MNKFIKEIKNKGYTKISSFLKKREIEKYLNILNSIYLKQKNYSYRGIPKRDKNDKIIYNLQNKDIRFINLITNPKIIQIAKYFLNDPYYRFLPTDKPNFILNYFNARSSGSKLDLHIDSHIPYKGKHIYMMQFLILLEESKKDNGCTVVVNGSHQSGKYSDRSTKKLNYLEGKAGDMFIWDSRVWHGTTDNRIKKSRWGIVATFSSWYIKQSMNMPFSLPNKIYKRCSNLQKQIIGFCSIPPINEHKRINTKTNYKSLFNSNIYLKN